MAIILMTCAIFSIISLLHYCIINFEAYHACCFYLSYLCTQSHTHCFVSPYKLMYDHFMYIKIAVKKKNPKWLRKKPQKNQGGFSLLFSCYVCVTWLP